MNYEPEQRPEDTWQPVRTPRASACSCLLAMGEWGSNGWHMRALCVPEQRVERSAPGGRTETILRPGYETLVAFERCPRYVEARARAKAEKERFAAKRT